jgi:hypothetical protein
VCQVVADEIAAIAAAHGVELERTGDPALLSLRGPSTSLARLCDVAETALKTVMRRLSADLIGGANVTRLDGALGYRHPRLPYRRALRIVGARGWRLSLGDEITPEAGASLVRFCGLLPVQVMYLPGQPQPAGGHSGRSGVSYILPLGGEVMRGVLPASEESGPWVCRVDLERLVGFAMGYGVAAAASA